MSDTNGERGPQGDHGQHGDIGNTGATGAQGPQGKRGPAFTGWAFARLLAFALVAVVAAYTLVQVQSESNARTDALARERERVGNVFLATLAQGSIDGCVSANEATYVDRAQLLDAIPNARPQYQQLVDDGTLTQAQADRLLANAQKQITKYLERRRYRDCVAAADRYLKLISDKTYQGEQRAELKIKVTDATQELKDQEAADEKRRG